MFTLFTVRVLRASTHLHDLVHFLGIYQFDSVTLSLVYFLSGPISENIFTSNVSRPKVLKYFSRIPITEIPCRPPHPGAKSHIYLQNFKVISTRGPIQIAFLYTKSKWEKYSRPKILFEQKDTAHCVVHKPPTHSKCIL